MDNYYTHYQICLKPLKNNLTTKQDQKYHIRKCTISKKTDMIVHIENYIFDKLKLNKLLSNIEENSYCFVNSDKFSNYNFPQSINDIVKINYIDIPKPKNTDNFNIYIQHVPRIDQLKYEHHNSFLKKYGILSSSV